MQRKLTKKRVSEEEEIKAAGLFLDFDEIAKKGSMSKEEGLISKWYGVYGSRHPGNLMVRMAIAGGVITASQARQIALTAENYAQGKINVSTRTALQYHWLKLPNVPLMLRELNTASVTTFHGCGDVARNITACQMAEVCPHRRLNVRPYAIKSARFIASCRDLDDLPRKFKVNWSGCDAGCSQPYMNCVGINGISTVIDGKEEVGFRVVIGGGMGWKAFVAQDLFSFVPQETIIPLVRAVALLFRDHGDRYDRAKSRLKFVVHNKGIDECRKLILQYLKEENIVTKGIISEPITYTGSPVPDRPLTDTEVKKITGEAVLRIRIPKGEMTSNQLRRLAELSEMFGNQKIYTTNRQNCELHGIDPEKLSRAQDEVHKIGLYTEGISSIKDIVACVGTTYCPKAVGTTRALYDRLVPVVSDPKYKSIENFVEINITGCPHSCSPHRITDIGFRGMRIREEQGSVEGFEMLIGGHQTKHGQVLGEFKLPDCAEVVETVLGKFIEVRAKNESLTDCVNRLGMASFKEAVFS